MQHLNLGHLLLIIGFLCSGGGALYLWIDSSNKAESILSTVTGGDSFCHLAIVINTDGNGGQWAIEHHGAYPLYGVLVDIVDLDLSRSLPNQPTYQQVISIHDRQQIGDIARGLVFLSDSIDFGGRDELRFNIFTYARNGVTIQNLRMRRIEGQWVKATRVFGSKSFGEKEVMLYERIDPDYPRDNNNIDWN